MEPLKFTTVHLPGTENKLPTILFVESILTWGPKDWEQYLERIDFPLRESLLPQHVWTKKIGNQYNTIFSESQSTAPEHISESVQQCLNKLTKRQTEVLRLLYWENKSEREAALLLKISRSSVRTIHKRSLLRCNQEFQKTEFKFKQF